MSTTNARTESFLWPDRVIGKRESREIRDAHNATVNELHECRAALARVTAQRDQLAVVAGGASGYLHSLPLAYRPDPLWFVSLDAALATLHAEGGAK